MPTVSPFGFRRVLLGLGAALFGLVIVVMIAGGAFAVWVKTADIKGLLERQASAELGRTVTAGRLAIRWGDPLSVEVTDLKVANAPWGSRPQMLEIGALSALVDLGALWRGVVRYERLRIDDATVTLERDP